MFSPYKILMVILVLHNIIVCKNVSILKYLYKKWRAMHLQNSPYKIKIGTKSE